MGQTLLSPDQPCVLRPGPAPGPWELLSKHFLDEQMNAMPRSATRPEREIGLGSQYHLSN